SSPPPLAGLALYGAAGKPGGDLSGYLRRPQRNGGIPGGSAPGIQRPGALLARARGRRLGSAACLLPLAPVSHPRSGGGLHPFPGQCKGITPPGPAVQRRRVLVWPPRLAGTGFVGPVELSGGPGPVAPASGIVAWQVPASRHPGERRSAISEAGSG